MTTHEHDDAEHNGTHGGPSKGSAANYDAAIYDMDIYVVCRESGGSVKDCRAEALKPPGGIDD